MSSVTHDMTYMEEEDHHQSRFQSLRNLEFYRQTHISTIGDRNKTFSDSVPRKTELDDDIEVRRQLLKDEFDTVSHNSSLNESAARQSRDQTSGG